MNRPVLRPALGWLLRLPEVGRPVTRLIDQEAAMLARIDELSAMLTAANAELRQTRAAALWVARKAWTADEIARAKQAYSLAAGVEATP